MLGVFNSCCDSGACQGCVQSEGHPVLGPVVPVINPPVSGPWRALEALGRGQVGRWDHSVALESGCVIPGREAVQCFNR